MQAIVFVFLAAIASCVNAAPREKRFAGAMSYAGPFGAFASPSRTFSSSMRSGSTSGFGGFNPFFPMPMPMPMPMPLFPFYQPWNWPAPEDYPVPWQMGPNVCNTTKIFESPNNEEMKEALKEMGVSFYSSGGFSTSESKEEMCKGECGNYKCLERKMTDSGMQTKIISYFCCEGFQLAADPKWGGWKAGCYEKPKEQADSQIPSDKEKEDEPTESPSTSWKNRMKYSYLSRSNSEKKTGVENVPPQ